MDEQVGGNAGPENENAVVEQVAEQVAQEPQTTEEKPEVKAEAPQETSEKPKRNGFTRKIERQQAEIEALKAQMAAIAPKPVDTDVKRPNWDEYAAAGKTTEQYLEDLADFKTDQKIKQTFTKTEEQQKQQEWKAQQESLVQNYRKQTAEFAKNTPDFYEVTGEVDFDMKPSLQQALLESEKAAELTYHLAKNPDLAESLNDMPYGKVARELGKLEAKLDTPKQVKTTTAPAPINPVGSKSKGELNPYVRDLSYEEHLEFRARQN